MSIMTTLPNPGHTHDIKSKQSRWAKLTSVVKHLLNHIMNLTKLTKNVPDIDKILDQNNLLFH